MKVTFLSILLFVSPTLFASSTNRCAFALARSGGPLTASASASPSTSDETSSISKKKKKKQQNKGTSSTTVISSGLNNLGNTCYLNAQLQCSFHIPYVRDLIIKSNQDECNENENENESIGLATLRTVFQSMLTSSVPSTSNPTPVSTTRVLCNGLGINVFEQQDSQEFWKLLLPVLEHRGLLDVYQGAFEDYIVAQDGSGREKRREEPFLDLSLEVGSGSVFESMKETFTKPELLSTAEGNGWRPEKGADRVSALKGSLLRVQGLPSVLQLHLKRFQYDWNTGVMSKINDCFLFPEELDLSSICADISLEEESDSVYDLQSIVVHTGEYGSGHYYSYVRPDITSSKWYRFDDHRVTEVDYLDDVIRDAFGGRMERQQSQKESKGKRGFLGRLFGGNGNARDAYGYGGRHSSAYMLQYVKRSDIPALYNE